MSKLQSGEAFRKIPRRLAYVVFMCTSRKDIYNHCFLELLVHVKSATLAKSRVTQKSTYLHHHCVIIDRPVHVGFRSRQRPRRTW